MEFLICPVPDNSISKLDPGCLFRSPAGVPFYYAVSFTDTKISISDTAYRYVEFHVDSLDELISQIKQAKTLKIPTITVVSGGDEVPFDSSEISSLLFILKRVAKYIKHRMVIKQFQDPEVVEAYLYNILVQGAES